MVRNSLPVTRYQSLWKVRGRYRQLPVRREIDLMRRHGDLGRARHELDELSAEAAIEDLHQAAALVFGNERQARTVHCGTGACQPDRSPILVVERPVSLEELDPRRRRFRLTVGTRRRFAISGFALRHANEDLAKLLEPRAFARVQVIFRQPLVQFRELARALQAVPALEFAVIG